METPEALAELFEERAAILEYEAGWPRAVAESEARRAVTRLAWLAGERKSGWIEPPARPGNAAGRLDGRPAASVTGGRCWD